MHEYTDTHPSIGFHTCYNWFLVKRQNRAHTHIHQSGSTYIAHCVFYIRRTQTHAHAQAETHTTYIIAMSGNNLIIIFLFSLHLFRSIPFHSGIFRSFSSACLFACLPACFLSNSIHVLRYDSCWSRLFSSMPLLCLFIFALAKYTSW